MANPHDAAAPADPRTSGPAPRSAPSAPVILDGLAAQVPDLDASETAEWLESFDAVVDAAGPGRARFRLL